jgi:phage-related holin
MKEFLLKTGVALLAVFAPIKSVVLVVGVLIVADLITGILAARKRGEKITSAGFRRTIVKGLVYQSSILLGHLTEQYLVGNDVVSITKIVAAVIGLVEFTSILENLNTINGSPIFAKLIEKLGSKNDLPPNL